MPSSYSRIILHTVFSTKYRKPLIHPDVEEKLYRFLRSRLEENGCVVYEINGAFDHVHLLHSLPRTKTIAKLMEDAKSLSSKFMKQQKLILNSFEWQTGYATFSVDYRDMSGLRTYIKRQKQHHYGTNDQYWASIVYTFKEEFVELLDKYECEYDPAFLWEEEPDGEG
ncbi:MAG: IS200/IS605 family transposase [Bacteroidota bacterium]